MAYLGTKPANQVIDSTLIADGTVTPSDLSTGKPVWDTSGNVGIGTNSPNSKLSFGTYTDTTSTDVKTIRLYDDSASSTIYGFGVSTAQLNYRCGTSSDRHVWYAGTTERMRIDGSGNLGIGTSSPTEKLHVNGDAIIGTNSIKAAGGIELGTLGTGDRNALIDFHSSGASGAIDFSARIIRQPAVDGNFVIANTGAGAIIFDVANAARASITPSRLNLIGTGSRGATGTVVTTANDSVASLVRQSGYIEIVTDVGAVGVTYFLSDERKKENITPCEKTSSDLIKDINFIQFDWKEDSGNSGHVDVGVSAQQLQSIDNRLVNELSDGSLMVNEPALVTHLAKALQEQQAIITELKTRIEALEQA
jgi:hypothetical protein